MATSDSEPRDPDFAWVRSQWKEPAPDGALTARVMAEYRDAIVTAEGARRWSWFGWAPLSVAFATPVIMLALLWHLRPQPPQYRAVEHPRLIVVSQGENP